MQSGGVPAAQTDLGTAAEQPAEAEPAAGPEPAAPDAAAPAEEPAEEPEFGREKKGELAEGKKGKIPPQFLKKNRKDVDEAKQKCMECGVGMYEAAKGGKMKCNECGHMMVMESNVYGNTLKHGDLSSERLSLLSKQGDWKAKAEIAKRKLMPNTPTAASMKPSMAGVSDPYEIMSDERLAKMTSDSKAKDELAKRKQHSSTAAKPAPVIKSVNEAKQVQEKAPPGFDPELEAKLKKQYKNDQGRAFATMWKIHNEKRGKKQESIDVDKSKRLLEAAEQRMAVLNKKFSAHVRQYNRMVSEGTTTDMLGLGYGLEGENLKQDMMKLDRVMHKARRDIAEHANMMAQREADRQQILNQIQHLKVAKSTSPYGVRWQNESGKARTKFFESASDRRYWMDLNEQAMTNAENIDPHHWDERIAKLTARV
jgi:DNA-directed RNA polymerase subunit RPC12/RpoP